MAWSNYSVVCYKLGIIVSFWDSNLSRYGHGRETYLSRYFLRARNPPKWVLAMRKDPSTVDTKETFHVDPRIPGDLAEKKVRTLAMLAK